MLLFIFLTTFLLEISITECLRISHEAHPRQRRQAAITGSAFPVNRWDPDRPIPYFFDAAFPEQTRAVVREAVAFWQAHSCVLFQETQESEASNAQRPRVRFYQQQEQGCFSEVGRDTQQPPVQTQNVSIGDNCAFFAPVAHEIGHVLGMIHTHVRSDRDAFIIIHPENEPDGMARDFVKMTTDESTNLGVEYDYGSIMHYTGYNQQTGKLIMEAKQARYQHTMGNTYGPVFSDLLALNRYYGCGRICLDVQSPKCQHSGFPNPKNCSECICPNGFGGLDCASRAQGEGGAPVDCGQTVVASSQWQTLEGRVDADPKGQMRQAGCHFHILAPVRQRIQIRVERLSGLCSPECIVGALELKFERITSAGARAHAAEFGLITTESDLAIASLYSQKDNRTFALSYRTVSTAEVPPFTNWSVPAKPINETAFYVSDHGDAACFDWSPNCAQYSHACKHDLYASNMRALCRKTCGYCDAPVAVPEECRDLATGCERISYLCASGSRALGMHVMCARTCGCKK